MEDLVKKMLRWALFGVIVSVVPIGASYLDLVMKDKAPTEAAILGDGGLSLTISAICAAALGEAIGSGGGGAVYKIISSGSAVVILMISSLLFASVIEGKLAHTYDEAAIATTSIWIFVTGLVPSAACVTASEL